MANYLIEQLDDLEEVRCPCGGAKRGFWRQENSPATTHLVTIKAEAETHYHKSHTEIYIILEGQGWVEVDGDRIPVRPLSAVMMLPGCRHRACGPLTLLNICLPAFDPNDEWFD